MLLNNVWDKNEIKKKIKRKLENMERKYTLHIQKSMGHCQSSSKKKIHSNTGLPQERRNFKIAI